MESRKRSFVKTMTFRVLATFLTVALVWVFTGSLILSAGIGGLDFISKMILYYFHERAWERIRWGERTPENQNML